MKIRRATPTAIVLGLLCFTAPAAGGFRSTIPARRAGNWHLPFVGSLGLLLTGALLAGTMHPERGFEGTDVAQYFSPAMRRV